jgi:putative transposase
MALGRHHMPMPAGGGIHAISSHPAEKYFFQEDLEATIAAFVEHYNHRRYHESLDNLAPADVYFGRGQTILLERERIKRDTIRQRRLNRHAKAA